MDYVAIAPIALVNEEASKATKKKEKKSNKLVFTLMCWLKKKTGLPLSSIWSASNFQSGLYGVSQTNPKAKPSRQVIESHRHPGLSLRMKFNKLPKNKGANQYLH